MKFLFCNYICFPYLLSLLVPRTCTLFQSINHIVRAPNFDPYSILNLPRNATINEVQQKYQRLASDPIPRHLINRDSLNTSEELYEAFSILSNENLRSAFDQYGMPGVIHYEHTGSLPVSLAPTFFNENLPGSASYRVLKHGPSTYCNLEINLVESINGCEKQIPIITSEPCSSCSGTGQQGGKPQTPCPSCSGLGTVGTGWNKTQKLTNCPDCAGVGSLIDDACPACSGHGSTPTERIIKVTIPKGTKHDSYITVHNEGEPNLYSRLRGSIYFKISITDKIFTVLDNTVHTELPITITTAITGGTASIPSPHGGEISINIPPGSVDGAQLIQKGKGIDKGDLIVTVRLSIPKIPTKLSPEEIASLSNI